MSKKPHIQPIIGMDLLKRVSARIWYDAQNFNDVLNEVYYLVKSIQEDWYGQLSSKENKNPKLDK